MSNEEIKRSAIIIAQAARLSGEVAAMQAANQERMRRGEALAYGEEAFTNLVNSYPNLEPGNAAHFICD